MASELRNQAAVGFALLTVFIVITSMLAVFVLFSEAYVQLYCANNETHRSDQEREHEDHWRKH